MREKKAADLQVGDTFVRSIDGGREPRLDSTYTVHRVQFVPIHDFFGRTVDTMQIVAENHLLGPANLTLNADETVWMVDGRAPMPPPPDLGDRGDGGRQKGDRGGGLGRWGLFRRPS